MRKLIHFIESEKFVYTTTLSVLFVQILQTAHLFHRISKLNLDIQMSGHTFTGFSWLHSLLCTFAIESAVLMLIVNGKATAAKWYAAASFLSSLLYFGDWEYFYFGGWEKQLPAIVASTLFSAMLAGSVLFFSELFAQKLASSKPASQPDSASQSELELASQLDSEIARLASYQSQPANSQLANSSYQPASNQLATNQKPAKNQLAASQKPASFQQQKASYSQLAKITKSSKFSHYGAFLENLASYQLSFASKFQLELASNQLARIQQLASSSFQLQPASNQLATNQKPASSQLAASQKPASSQLAKIEPASFQLEFSCPDCQQNFSSRQALNAHRRAHKPTSLFTLKTA